MTENHTTMQKLSVYQMAWPADWAALFSDLPTAPLIVEIGFGYGHYLLHLANTQPDARLVGLEITNKCLTKVERLLIKRGIQNTRLIFSTAETALYHLFEPATVSAFHINFPDPWFKSRHEHRRLMKPPTVNALVNRLATGGMMYLATDIFDYAEMTAELLEAADGLDNALPERWANVMPGRAITKYEARAQREGRTCYYFAYRRNTQPPPIVPHPQELEQPMPHVVFYSPLSLDDIHGQFGRQEHHAQETHVRFLEVFRGKNTLLFDVFIREMTIDQRLTLLLAPHSDIPERFTLKLGTIGQPRPTAGVHFAVKLLGEWLVGLHPESRWAENKLQDVES